MSDCKVIKSEKGKFFVKSVFTYSRVFLFINIY